MPAMLSRSKRLTSGWATTIASRTAAASSTPNQRTGLNPAKSGTPTSMSRCASQRRSKPSSDTPRRNVMATIRSSTVLPRIRRVPCRAVPTMERAVVTSCCRAGRKFVSGIASARNAPRASSATPPSTIGRRRSTTARPTAAPMATRPATRAACAPRWYAPPRRSWPISSASQASIAPLLNVQPKPMNGLRNEDDGDAVDRARDDEARAHDHLGDDDRESPAVRVRHDAGGYLEEEVRHLERRPGEDELERRHVDIEHEVDRRDGPRRASSRMTPQPGRPSTWRTRTACASTSSR